VLIGEEV
jgi:6-phosphofructokinase